MSDVLEDLERAAARKWQGDPDAQQAGLFARAAAELAEWRKLRDPVMLHANLLRGIPAQLDRATFLHLAGADQLMRALQLEGLASTEGVGLESERDRFEHYMSDGGKYPEAVRRAPGDGPYLLMMAQVRWETWQTAVAAERERWRDLAQRVARQANDRGLEGMRVRCTISETGALVSWEVCRA